MEARARHPAVGRPVARARAAAWIAGTLLAGRALAVQPPRAEHEQVRIELRPEVEISAPQVRLGDVAILTTLDLPTLERLVALPLGPAPRAGAAISLERAPLLRWIRARIGIPAEAIRWVGPTESVVRAAVDTLSGEELAGCASEAMTAALAASGLRVEGAAPQTPRDVVVPAGTREIRARPVLRASILSRRPSVWVDVIVDGRFVRAVPVRFDLDVFGPGYVATSRVARGEVLDPLAVEVREVRVSGLDALPVTPEVLGKVRARRPVERGTTVARSQVEAVPLVRRGSWATLRTSRGLVSVEGRVEVLEDGRSGQTVHVKVTGAEEAVLARVTGQDTVEVEQ